MRRSGASAAPDASATIWRGRRLTPPRTAAYAAAHGYDAFATSLTVSPHKVSQVIFEASADKRFLKADFKKRDGFRASLERSAELGLYRQDYCGCEFSRPRNGGVRMRTEQKRGEK